MAQTVAEIVTALGSVAPLAKAAGWDPVGLQLGDPSAGATRVAVCHEVTEGVVARIEDHPVDLLVTYHPLLFRPTTSLVVGPGAAGRAFRLVRAGVSLCVVHTAFDVAPAGAADALADALGLSEVAGFGPSWGPDTVKIVTFAPAEVVDAIAASMADAGAGEIGNYAGCSFRTEGTGTFQAGAGTEPATGTAGATNAEPEVRIEMIASSHRLSAVVAALVAAHPYEEPAYDVYQVQANAGFVGRRGRLATPVSLESFAGHVARTLDTQCRIAGDRTSEVRTVAVVPGSGGSLLPAVNADVVVTGDVRHHEARSMLERGRAVIDAGHVATERPGVARLYAAVARVVEGAVDLTGVDADPWRG